MPISHDECFEKYSTSSLRWSLLANYDLAVSIDAMDLKHLLC